MKPVIARTTKHPLKKGYIGKTIDNGRDPRNRIMVGIPMTGLLRSEWVLARYGQVIPCNWSTSDCVMWLDQYSPLRFSVADARNLIVDAAVRQDFEWLFFIDHDTIMPPTTLLKMNEYMLEGDIPIVGGLYFTKSVPAEPLVYRGSGTSHYRDWHLGDKVWVDGLGMGCTLIHVSSLFSYRPLGCHDFFAHELLFNVPHLWVNDCLYPIELIAINHLHLRRYS